MSKTQLVEVKKKDMKKDDIIIAFMGPTGAGKTNFIDNLEGAGTHRAGHNLKSSTRTVTPWRLKGHAEFQDRIVFLDTPGFDDTSRTDMEILQEIATWLQKTYESHVHLSGMVYLHRITDVRMGGTPQRNLRMFARLCGEKAANKVRLITTMWDMEGEVLDNKGKKAIEVFQEREKQLQDTFWRGMLDNQATMGRYSNDPTTAWLAIQPLLSEEREKLSLYIQQELVDHRLRLNETKAGKLAYDNIHGFLDMERQKIEMMKKRAAGNPELMKQLETLEREYNTLLAEAEKQKIGFVRKVMLMFQKKPKGALEV